MDPQRVSTRSVDVAVIGGGAAGLSGALMLARSRRSVTVIDSGRPRNAPADAVHGLFARDGVPPAQLLSTGREEVERYGGQVVAGEVHDVSRTDEGFDVQLTDGQRLVARRLLIATGLRDVLPEVAGLAERWGKDVLHCPYCHGYEVRDRAIGVLATGPNSVHHALLFRQLSEDVVYFTHTTSLRAEQETQFAARGIEIVRGRVLAVELAEGRLTAVRLEGGGRVNREVIVVASRMEAHTTFLAGLGVDCVEHAGDVGSGLSADATGRTSVEGVWAAGNVVDLTAQVGAAAAAGATAGAHVNADLVAEDTRRAVAAATRRDPGPPLPGRPAPTDSEPTTCGE